MLLLAVPSCLSNDVPYERRYKNVFHFRYVTPETAGHFFKAGTQKCREYSFPGKWVPDFLNQKFQVSDRESIPREDPDQDDWKRGSRD